jgi:hypothetical protein
VKDLELLIAMIREAISDDPAAEARATRLRRAHEDRAAREVMAWACPSLLTDHS